MFSKYFAQARLALVVFALCSGLANAANLETVPQTMNFQGNLVDASGTPLQGPVPMRFGIYLANTRVWYAEYDVITRNGTFSVVLGGTAQGGISLDPITAAAQVPVATFIPILPDFFGPGLTPSTDVTIELEIYQAGAFQLVSPRFHMCLPIGY